MPLAVEVLRALKASGIETHLICTDSAARTLSLETNLALEDLQGLSHTVYDNRNIGCRSSQRQLSHGRYDRCSMQYENLSGDSQRVQ